MNSNGKRGCEKNTAETAASVDSTSTNDAVAGTETEDISPSDEPRAKLPKILKGKSQTGATQSKASSQAGPSQKKAKSAKPNITKATAEEDKIHTDAEVQAFVDGVKNLTDWTSTSVKPRYIELTRWHDVDGLTIKQCSQKWVAVGYGVAKPLKDKKGDKKDDNETPQVTQAAIYKNYNRYAKQFYEEKGITWVPPKARKIQTSKKKPVTSQQMVSYRQSDENGAEETEDEEEEVQDNVQLLEWMEKPASPSLPQDDTDLMVFSAQPDFDAMRPEQRKKKGKEPDGKVPKLAPEDEKLARPLSLKKTGSKPETLNNHLDKTRTAFAADNYEHEIEAGDRDAETDLFKVHQASKNSLSFKREAGDVSRDHPTRLVLSRAIALQHSAFVRAELKVDADIDTIEYGEDIDESTVTRYIACISPCLRPSLPTHDVAELNTDGDDERFRATPIQWSMQELEDLYVFAHAMGTPDVCDMVIDRVYEDLHRLEPRSIHDQYGRRKAFSVVNFSPGFLNYLQQYDARGSEFFAYILVRKGGDTLKAMLTAGLSNWHHSVKLALEGKLESKEGSVASKENGPGICSTYHHHGGSADQCYRSKASTPTLTSAHTPRNAPASNLTKRTNRPESFTHKARHALWERMDRWNRQRAYHQKMRKANKARMRWQSTPEGVDADGRAQKQFEDDYDERDGEDIESATSSDSCDDEDGNSVTIRLNSEYIQFRSLFRNPVKKHKAPGVYAQPPESGKSGKWIKGHSGLNEDAPQYSEKGINPIKDSERTALEKYYIVQEKLQMFRDYGYDVDGLCTPTPSTAVGSRLRSEDVEMEDEDEDAHVGA